MYHVKCIFRFTEFLFHVNKSYIFVYFQEMCDDLSSLRYEWCFRQSRDIAVQIYDATALCWRKLLALSLSIYTTPDYSSSSLTWVIAAFFVASALCSFCSS